MNMSYCRMENTFHDLQDCYDALSNGEVSSTSEKQYAKKLIELCKDIVNDFGDESAIEELDLDDDFENWDNAEDSLEDK